MQKIGDSEVEQRLADATNQISNFFPCRNNHVPIKELEASKSYTIGNN